jgi:hypothetical protein
VLRYTAQAIQLHSVWQDLPQGLFIVRCHPTPLIAVMGTLSKKSFIQLKLQPSIINDACSRLRYLSYTEVVTACEQLAAQLLKALGAQKLRECRFCGIPRGGFIVLGMLSYALGLRSEQLQPPYPEDTPLVIVDDCALSGSRYAQAIRQYPNHKLILAPLYAHPTLRAAMVEAHSQVLMCLSGEDLMDHGEEVMGEQYQPWQTQNQKRLAGKRYWLGLPDYICFPWNEPDHLLWNPITETLEKSWPIVPPDYCLKNRLLPHNPAIDIQVQPQAMGWLQPNESIVFGELKGHILIGHLETGETFGLSDRSIPYWQVLRTTQSFEEAISVLSNSTQLPELTLRQELKTFMDQLIDQEILCPA